MPQELPPVRVYVVMMWDWRGDSPSDDMCRIRAFDAADAKTQAQVIMERAGKVYRNGQPRPILTLRGIAPYEEHLHGEPPWFQ